LSTTTDIFVGSNIEGLENNLKDTLTDFRSGFQEALKGTGDDTFLEDAISNVEKYLDSIKSLGLEEERVFQDLAQQKELLQKSVKNVGRNEDNFFSEDQIEKIKNFQRAYTNATNEIVKETKNFQSVVEQASLNTSEK
jgi:hypothetical protein